MESGIDTTCLVVFQQQLESLAMHMYSYDFQLVLIGAFNIAFILLLLNNSTRVKRQTQKAEVHLHRCLAKTWKKSQKL